MESPPTHPAQTESPQCGPDGLARPGCWWRQGLAAAALIAGGYVALVAYADDRLPRLASIDGVPVAGLTREESVAQVREAANARLHRPLRIHGPDGWSTTLTPAA